MPTNWPPAGNQVPPFEASDWDSLMALFETLKSSGWTNRAPTNQENNQIFNAVRCDMGHPVIGRVVIAPASRGGTSYYFATCNTDHEAAVGVKSRAFFTAWPPFYSNNFDR